MRTPRGGRSARAGGLLLVAACCTLLASVVAAGAAGAQGVTPVQGSAVVSEFRTGRVALIAPDGSDGGTVVDGLNAPRGVAVLADGTVLVAEFGAGRIVGVGGRLGSGVTEVAPLDAAEAIAVAPDGRVLATSVLRGEVVEVDVDAKSTSVVASGLKGPAGMAVRDDTIYVAETTGGRVAAVAPDGSVSTAAEGFEQPIGVAFGPDGSLFVSDFAAEEIIQVAPDDTRSTFASLAQPVGLTTEPFPAVAGQPFTLLAAGEPGVVRYDASGTALGTTAVPVPIGVGAFPTAAAAGTTGQTTVPQQPGTSLEALPELPKTSPTTRERRSATTSIYVAPTSESAGTSSLLVGLLVVIAAGLGAGGAYLVLRQPRGSAEAGFEETPLDVDSIAEAFGPCAGEEVELAEAEGGLKALRAQREAADQRQHDAQTAVEFQNERVADAGRARADAERLRLDAVRAGRLESPEPRELALDDLALGTDAGRAAFAQFQRGELDAGSLEARWIEAGETTAVEVVRAEGERLARSNPDGPWPEEIVAIEDERAASAALLRAERDLAEARADLARLAERESEAVERIAEARRRLSDCQRRHRIDDWGDLTVTPMPPEPAGGSADGSEATPAASPTGSLFANALGNVKAPPPPPPAAPPADSDAAAGGPTTAEAGAEGGEGGEAGGEGDEARADGPAESGGTGPADDRSEDPSDPEPSGPDDIAGAPPSEPVPDPGPVVEPATDATDATDGPPTVQNPPAEPSADPESATEAPANPEPADPESATEEPGADPVEPPSVAELTAEARAQSQRRFADRPAPPDQGPVNALVNPEASRQAALRAISKLPRTEAEPPSDDADAGGVDTGDAQPPAGDDEPGGGMSRFLRRR